MELHDLLLSFLSEFADEIRSAPQRAANRLRDRLGESVELSGSQVNALATLVADGSVASWIDSGQAPPAQGGFDVASAERWAKNAWAAAVSLPAGVPPPPQDFVRGPSSITRSSGFPGEMRPLSNRRTSALGDVDFAVLPNGEIIRLVTVQASVPEPTAEAVAARLPALPTGTLAIAWVERDDQHVRLGSRHATVDSLAARIEQGGPLASQVALPLLSAVGTTLSECHKRGVRHGALTAESVVFDAGGAPCLADVGVAETLGRTVSESADSRDFAAMVHRTVTGRDPTTGDLHVSASETTPLRTALGHVPAVTRAVEELLAGHTTTLEPLVHALRQDVGGPSGATVVATVPPPPPPTQASWGAPGPAVPTVLAVAAPPTTERPAGRRRGILVGAVAMAALLLLGGLVWALGREPSDGREESQTTDPSTETTDPSTDSSPETTGPTTETTESVVVDGITTTVPVPAEVTFQPFNLSENVSVQRIWTVDGNTVLGTVTITNSRAYGIGVLYDEVIPKELAANLEGIVFEPAYTEVINPDPIVRFSASLDPGQTFTMTYRVPVASPPDDATLDTWATNWQQAYTTHLADPTLSPADADADGVSDIADECDTEQGALNGCRDGDGDGFKDTGGDYCPDRNGPTGGCPDDDLDGVIDDNDQCKGSPGRPGRADGCPDGDEDGVRDNADNCKDKKGPASNNGCPVPVTAAAKVTINGPTSANGVACPGGTFTVTVTGMQAASYRWSASSAYGSGTGSGSSYSPCFTFTGSAYTVTISVTVTGTDGTQKSDTHTVTVS